MKQSSLHRRLTELEAKARNREVDLNAIARELLSLFPMIMSNWRAIRVMLKQIIAHPHDIAASGRSTTSDYDYKRLLKLAELTDLSGNEHG